MNTAMENHQIPRKTVSFGISLALCSLANALLVMTKEKSPAVLEAMKGLSGHHWLTHCIILFALWFLLAWVVWMASGRKVGLQASGERLPMVVASGVLLGALLIVVFYLVEG